jgi:CRISPR-associated protein Csb2
MGAGPDFLVLEAKFLAGTYGGVEWPPSPFRLLQAIVAGCRSIDVPGLEWMEKQPAPFILATDEPVAVRFRKSIPNNADPRKPNSALSLRDVVHRRVDGSVRYGYALRSQADRDAAALVIAAAAQVHTLGTGEDMCTVSGHVTALTPESNPAVRLWMPLFQSAAGVRVDSEAWLRVPLQGSLQSLEARFQAFQRRLSSGEEGYARPVAAPALHRTLAYRPSEAMPRTAVFAMRLGKPGQEKSFSRFRAEDAVVVAGMLRHASMRVAKSTSPHLDDFAAGYGTESDAGCRMSWIPLPSVGHAHSDGLIRRALWISRANDAEALGALAAAVPAEGLPLVDEDTGECIATAAPVDPSDEPMLAHYLAPATDWVSVTPVVLPGDYGGGNLRVMTKLLHKAVREAGIDPGLVAEVEFSKSGFTRHAASLRELRLKDWKAKNLILYHVNLRFRSPIRGPIILGRGRHFGLGLFCANPQ